MKNTRKHLIWLMVGLLIPILYAIFFMFGCATPEDSSGAPVGYDTIDGIYRVHVIGTENTCSPPDTELIIRWDWLLVTVQEKRQDGGHLADFDLADLSFHDVNVLSSDYFYFEEVSYNVFVSRIYGTIDSKEIYATIELPVLDYESGEEICNIVYDVEGYKLFSTLPPPEDMER